MKHFLITIPDEKEILFSEMMNSVRFVEKMEAINSAALPEMHEEIAAARFPDRDELADCCLSWEEIDQIIAS